MGESPAAESSHSRVHWYYPEWAQTQRKHRKNHKHPQKSARFSPKQTTMWTRLNSCAPSFLGRQRMWRQDRPIKSGGEIASLPSRRATKPCVADEAPPAVRPPMSPCPKHLFLFPPPNPLLRSERPSLPSRRIGVAALPFSAAVPPVDRAASPIDRFRDGDAHPLVSTLRPDTVPATSRSLLSSLPDRAPR